MDTKPERFFANRRAVAIVPKTNVKRSDATGAFHPEAGRFLKMFGRSSLDDLLFFDNLKGYAGRRKSVTTQLTARVTDVGLKYHTLAFFCHGWASGIQAGFLNGQVNELAKLIEDSVVADAVIVLYCCSTGTDVADSPKQAAGTGDNSFADRLRDALCRTGNTKCRVVAHSTAAHTTQNPNARFFDGNGSNAGGVGGYPVVGPKTSIWRPWVTRLRTTDLRFRFPYMTIEEIHAELQLPVPKA